MPTATRRRTKPQPESELIIDRGLSPPDVPAVEPVSSGLSSGRFEPALPLELIDFADNYRRTVPEAELLELSDSILAKGVIQAVVVRPVSRSSGGTANKKQRFELVVGERRVRASRLANQATIPAMVRVLSDQQAAEIRLIENLQRADVHPLEEAHGFRDMLDRHGYTADQLALKINKSRGYVYGILKLTQLPEAAAKAFQDGVISKSVAQLIARIPDAKARAEMTKWATSEDRWDGVPTFQQVKAEIERTCMRELKGAPFAIDDGDLLPVAGPCASCPKMAGNNRTEYPDGRADVCTDPACYAAKVAAHSQQAIAAHKAAGGKVLTKTEAKRVFYRNGNLAYDAPYVDLASETIVGDKWITYKKAVGKDLAGEVVLGTDPSGALHELVPRAKATAAVKKIERAKAKATPEPKLSAHEQRWKQQQAKQREQEKVGREVARRACEEVARVGAELADHLLWPEDLVKFFRGCIVDLIEADRYGTPPRIAKRRGIEPAKKGKRSADSDRSPEFQRNSECSLVDGLIAKAMQLSGPELLGLLGELAADKQSNNWAWQRKIAQGRTMSAAGVDPAAIKRTVASEQRAAKSRSSGGTAKKGGAK